MRGWTSDALARESIDRVQRMHWWLLAERLWSPAVAQMASARIPPHLHGQDRIDFHRDRETAQDILSVLFPNDEVAADGEP